MNAQGKSLQRLWSRLPNGELTEPELDAAILKSTNAYEGDRALARSIRASLLLAQVVLATQDEDGKLSYRKAATFPVWSDNSPGTPAYNERIRQMAEAEERMHRENDAAKARDAQNSPWGFERRARLEEIDNRLAASVRPLREEIAELKAEIRSLREQLAVTVAA